MLHSGRHKSCKECIFALSTVEDHHGERIPSVFSPDLGKKPSSVSRGENRSGRWSNRASTTLPTGYFPAPEIRRTVPTMDTRRFELPIAVAIIPWSVINRRSCIACKVGDSWHEISEGCASRFLLIPRKCTQWRPKFCDIVDSK